MEDQTVHVESDIGEAFRKAREREELAVREARQKRERSHHHRERSI